MDDKGEQEIIVLLEI